MGLDSSCFWEMEKKSGGKLDLHVNKIPLLVVFGSIISLCLRMIDESKSTLKVYETDMSNAHNVNQKSTLMDALYNPKALKSIEKLTASFLDKTHRNQVGERWRKGLSTLALIAAITGLSGFDKMTPVAGEIEGTLA